MSRFTEFNEEQISKLLDDKDSLNTSFIIQCIIKQLLNNSVLMISGIINVSANDLPLH